MLQINFKDNLLLPDDNTHLNVDLMERLDRNFIIELIRMNGSTPLVIDLSN